MQVDALAPAALAAGWLGQACFFSRFFVQWLASERARSSVVPRSFWWLSLGGAVLASAYALARGSPLLVLGFVTGAATAARNLLLARARAPLAWRRIVPLALLFLAGLLWSALAGRELALAGSPAWLAVGVLGQLLWAARFPVQWLLSEHAGRSHFPPSFWWLSLAGNGFLLAYTLHLRDPLLVLSFLPGPVLQARNLVLARRGSRRG